MVLSRKYSVMLLGLLLWVIPASAHAQQQKAGYLDTDFILSQMPEYQGLQQQLSVQSEEWNKELEQLEAEIEQLKEDFESKEILYTDELKAQKQQEINELIEQRQQFLNDKFGADGEYFQLQQKLLEPIQRKIMEAVTVIAEREGYDFVFDRAQDTNMLYGSPQWNLTDHVLQELGVTLNNPSN